MKLRRATPTGRVGRPVDLGEIVDHGYDSVCVVVSLTEGQIFMQRAEAQAMVDHLRRALAFQATEWGYPAPVDAPVDRDVGLDPWAGVPPDEGFDGPQGAN
jgi:hypothetical protein